MIVVKVQYLGTMGIRLRAYADSALRTTLRYSPFAVALPTMFPPLFLTAMCLMQDRTLSALRRLQKAEKERHALGEQLLAAWEQLYQRNPARAAALWDDVEAAWLAGEEAGLRAMLERLK